MNDGYVVARMLKKCKIYVQLFTMQMHEVHSLKVYTLMEYSGWACCTFDCTFLLCMCYDDT